MSKIIGIDFGTTKTIAAILENGSPVVIPDRRGRNSIPSIVLVTPENERLVFAGWEAKEHSSRYHIDHLTISSIKRLLGKEGKSRWGWLHEHPEAVAGLILARLKLEVEHELGENIEKVVIAIPANYNTNQRWAIKQAAKLAGLQVLRLINEATAAALYYNYGHPKDQLLLIFDFGGGTLDVSVVEVGGGFCEVKATAGDGELGGDDFDQVLMNYVSESVFADINDFNSLELFQQLVLKEAVIRAKIELSSAQSTRIYLPGFIQDSSGTSRDMDITIQREKFEELSRNLISRAEGVIKQAMKDANIDKPDAALIIGGGSRIPAIRELVRTTVGLDPFIGVDPEICVAQGAAVQAGILGGEKTDMLLMDVTPQSLSIELQGGIASQLIVRNTTIPTRKSEIFSTAADNQTEVNIKVLSGERPMADDNAFIGSLALKGIPPAPRGVAQIEVTFDVESSGILNVSAKDVGTGKEIRAEIDAPFNINAEELANTRKSMEQMIANLAVHLTYDEEKRRIEKCKRRAEICKLEIEGLIETHKNELDERQIAVLQVGAQLLSDYPERGCSDEDLEKMCTDLKLQVEIFISDK